MADISPGQFPTTPSFTSVNFRIITPTISSETSAGKIRRVGFGHSFYTFDVKYQNLTYNLAGIVQGFVALAQGPLLSFEIVLPEISYSDAAASTTANATITSSATITAGQRWVNVNNCGANATVLLAGDYFRFANHSKVYMTTTDVVATSGGTANISFSGASVSGVPSGTRLHIQAVPFTVILADTMQEYEVGQRGITNLSLSMREVW